MMNLTSSDRNGPIQYVDTAYDALKYNVPATQQVMQAAQQGQPVGLAGLGAMAAQKFQQQAQQGQQAQQAQQTAQAPSPTVLQQILASSGIMGQFQPNLELGQAPTEMPQQMAMGGLVALNEGGFIDYSYDGGQGYADGGAIRGFATGSSELLRARGIPDASDYFKLGDEAAFDQELEREMEEEMEANRERAAQKSRVGQKVTEESTLQKRAGMYQPETPASYEETYGKSPPSSAGPTAKRPPYADVYGESKPPAGEYQPYRASEPAPAKPSMIPAKPSMIEGMSQSARKPTDPIAEKMAKSGKAPYKPPEPPRTLKGTLSNAGKGLRALGRFAGPLGWAEGVYGMYDTITDPRVQEEFKQDWKDFMPGWLGGEGEGPKAGIGMGEASAAEETPKAAPNPKAKAKGVEEPTAAHKRENAKSRKYGGTRGTETTPINPQPVPGEDAIAEHQKVVDEASGLSKRGELPPNPPIAPKPEAQATPTPTPTPSQAGIASIPVGGGLEELQKLYMGDTTGKLSPETASRLEAMQEQATRDKWLQTLTGFGAGMFGAETPYLSQAIASGAMKGLSAYQQGAQNEEQAELRSLQAQMAAEKEPREAQQKAVNTFIQAQLQQGKSMAEIRKALEVARINAQTRAQSDVFKAGAAKERAQIIAGGMGGLKEAKAQADINNINSQIAARKLEISDKARAKTKEQVATMVPAPTPDQWDQMYQKNYQEMLRDANIPPSLGGGTGLGGGAGMGGRPMIMGRTGALSTPQ